MRTYEGLTELARLCAYNARLASSEEVAIELWKMACEYQQEAGKLDGGKLPDIGSLPYWLVEGSRFRPS
jgi:hypothetical protein